MPVKKEAKKKEVGQETPQIPFIGLTLQEAAQALRCQERSVRRFIQEKGLPARVVGGRWLISPAALDAWLAAGRYETENTGKGKGKN